MKRFFAFFLTLLLTLPLISCGTAPLITETEETQTQATAPSQTTQEAQTTTKEQVDTYDYPEIKEMLSWERVNSFPVKSSTMTIEELRQLCVSFFRYSKTALWTPDENWDYIRNAAGSKDNMKKGQIYGGLPYIGVASGNVYRLLGYMDPVTGAVDMSEATKNPKLFGNQCSIGAYWGWARVINSADYDWTQNMVQSNGFLRIGPYTYDDAVFTSFNDKDRTTIDVCSKNGKQKMFESYALLQPGDGLVYYTTAGHVIMCSVKAEVVRDANGEIDGDKSHIYIIDQGQSWVSMTNASGDSFKAKGSVDAKKSFNSLYKGYYLPFTFAEFLGTDPVEETECTFSHTEKDITVKQLTQAEVNANYGIADVYVIVKDSAGNLVYEKPIHSTMAGIVKVAMKGTVIEATWNRYAGNGNTVEVVCQLGTGERLTVYKGNLLK